MSINSLKKEAYDQCRVRIEVSDIALALNFIAQRNMVVDYINTNFPKGNEEEICISQIENYNDIIKKTLGI